MIVKNPTDSELKVQINGRIYEVDAKGETSVPAEVALYWRDNIHGFLILSEESKTTVKPTPIVTPTVEETEPVVEETVSTETVETTEEKKEEAKPKTK